MTGKSQPIFLNTITALIFTTKMTKRFIRPLILFSLKGREAALMFCSNCGEQLGAVAHILNNELLCENCFLKLSPGAPPSSSYTIAFGLGNDEERMKASNEINALGSPQPEMRSQGQVDSSARESAVGESSVDSQNPKTPSDESSLILKYLTPGETLLWKRSFSKGIINRHLTYTEFVTNKKAVCIDDEHGTPVRCALLQDAVIAITRERRDYSGTRTGYGHYGVYGGTSSGHSVTFGDLDFLVGGRVAMTLFNVRDPQGLKRLIEASVKSSRTVPHSQ
jgi:hypothetical protein